MDGEITVHKGKIRVVCRQDGAVTQTGYVRASVENLRDAARVLASWMDLGFEEVASECRRVHLRDQQMAELRAIVTDVIDS